MTVILTHTYINHDYFSTTARHYKNFDEYVKSLNSRKITVAGSGKQYKFNNIVKLKRNKYRNGNDLVSFEREKRY